MTAKGNKYIEEIITKKIYSGCPAGQVKIIPIAGGGSFRTFWRITAGDNRSLVYMEDDGGKEENKFYYDIDRLLEKIGVKVPRILYRDEKGVFMEDLGCRTLFDVMQEEDRDSGLYFKVLDQLITLHREGEAVFRKSPFKISRPFGYSLYRWEAGYFMDNLISGYYGIQIKGNRMESLEEDLDYMAKALAGVSMVLIHRDCQSKNIMVKGGLPYFIDFQGARYGPAQYDLASLLEDPYVDMPDEKRNELLEYYRKRSGAGANFSGIYRLCAVQRLLQAVGAYAFLGLKKNKKWFLQFIPKGLRRLKSVLAREDGLTELRSLLP